MPQRREVSILIERSISDMPVDPVEMKETQLQTLIRSVSDGKPLGLPNLISVSELSLTEVDQQLNQSSLYPRWWANFEKEALDNLLNTFSQSLDNVVGKNQPFVTLSHIN